MKVEALENRQLLSHEALLLLGDATATDHATEFMGNTYNGFEQSSLVASYAATPGELTRVSFLDLDGDVVFAEFGGNGKLTISFEQYESGSAFTVSSEYYLVLSRVGHSERFGWRRVDLPFGLLLGK